MSVEIKIVRKNIKYIRVSATTETLLVSAPKYLSERDILATVREHEAELLKLIEKERSKKYVNNIGAGEIYLFGELLEPEISKTLTSEVKIEKFYRGKLEEVLKSIFLEFNSITGLVQDEYKIRKMKARWGTCYPTKKLININLFLAKRPIDEIKLVVLHELVHLKHPNHSRDFYREIAKYIENYGEVQRRLKE